MMIENEFKVFGVTESEFGIKITLSGQLALHCVYIQKFDQKESILRRVHIWHPKTIKM